MRSFTLPEVGLMSHAAQRLSPGKVCRATSGHGRKLVFDPGLMKSVGQEVREAGARQKEGRAGND